MSPKTLRTIIAVFLFVHAIGHVQGVMVALGFNSMESWHARSWLFDRLLGEKGSRLFAAILFTVCILGFLATAFSFLGIGIPHDLWRTLAVIFAAVSVFGSITYWNALAAFFNKVGSLGVNGWILIGMLLMNWPTETELGWDA